MDVIIILILNYYTNLRIVTIDTWLHESPVVSLLEVNKRIKSQVPAKENIYKQVRAENIPNIGPRLSMQQCRVINTEI